MTLWREWEGEKPLMLPSCAVDSLGIWAWEAEFFLGVGLLQLCQGAEQHFESLALNYLLFVV